MVLSLSWISLRWAGLLGSEVRGASGHLKCGCCVVSEGVRVGAGGDRGEVGVEGREEGWRSEVGGALEAGERERTLQ